MSAVTTRRTIEAPVERVWELATDIPGSERTLKLTGPLAARSVGKALQRDLDDLAAAAERR